VSEPKPEKPFSWRRAWRHLAFLVNGSATQPERRTLLQRVFRYVRRISDAYSAHQCSLMACACAYCALLSLVPILVLGIAALGFWMGDPQSALKLVTGNLRQYTPSADFVLDLQNLLERIFADRQLFGALGILGLLWAAHQTFLMMQPAMNIIWVVPENRHWFRQRLIALGATLLSLLQLGVDLLLTRLYFQALDRVGNFVSDRLFAGLSLISTLLLQVLLMAQLFATLYRMLPARRIPWKSAYLGALVATILWQATKFLYTAYFIRVPANAYALIYGSLGSLVIFVVWTYVSMSFLLLGAEIAADYESMQHSLAEAEARAHSGADLATAHGVAPHSAATADPPGTSNSPVS
jgi:membrane protein